MKRQQIKSIVIMYFVISVSAFSSFGQSQIDKQKSKVDTILIVVKIEGSTKEVLGTTNVVSENLFDLKLNWIRSITNLSNQNALVMKYQGILNNLLIRNIIYIEIDKSFAIELPVELRIKLGYP